MTKYAHLKEVEEGGCRTSTSKSTSEIVISSSSASTLTARLYNIFFALSLLIFGFAAGFSLNMSDEIFGSADRPGILGTDTTATIIKQIMESRYDPPPLFVPGKLYGKVFNKGGKLKDQKLTNIPNLVHITLQNKNSPDWIVGSWKANNPNFNVVLYDDDDILEFMTDVSKFNPNILEIYHSLAAIVEKTDYWRYLIMYYFGGVYIDSDVQALQGIESWPFWSSSNITAVVGIEFILKEEDILPYEATSTHQYLQFVLVGDKRHDLFRVAVRKVGENVNRELEGHHRYPEKYNSQMRVLFRTGPGAWTDSVWEYFRSYNFREFDVKANDVIGSVYVADKLVLQKQLVLHHQRGSWKHNPTP